MNRTGYLDLSLSLSSSSSNNSTILICLSLIYHSCLILLLLLLSPAWRTRCPYLPILHSARKRLGSRQITATSNQFLRLSSASLNCPWLTCTHCLPPYGHNVSCCCVVVVICVALLSWISPPPDRKSPCQPLISLRPFVSFQLAGYITFSVFPFLFYPASWLRLCALSTIFFFTSPLGVSRVFIVGRHRQKKSPTTSTLFLADRIRPDGTQLFLSLFLPSHIQPQSHFTHLWSLDGSLQLYPRRKTGTRGPLDRESTQVG